MTTDNLLALREQIDKIDREVQQLVSERAKIAIEVGSMKRKMQQDDVFYRPEREAQILQNIIDRNTGPLSEKQITAIFRTILTACLSLQQAIKIAYLGPAGTYSQSAAFKHFGFETNTVPVASIDQIFREIESDNAHYGVVPIENSSTGTISQTLDALIHSPLAICGEIILPIHHNLLVKNNAVAFSNIKKVYAHEQALMQCRQWLNSNVPNAELIAVSSNGAAAQLVQTEENAAAIASDLAAEIYQLSLLEKNIEDLAQNETRFLILGKQKVAPTHKDKTSLLITTPHTPGSLIDLLQPFASNHVNISLIESRPYRDRNWSYIFFIDIDGHQQDLPVKKALEALAEKSILLHVLGSYPKALY